MVFSSDIHQQKQERGVVRLDYKAQVDHLRKENELLMGFTGNYSLAGLEMKLSRCMTKYIIQYYLTTGIFVIFSWVS